MKVSRLILLLSLMIDFAFSDKDKILNTIIPFIKKVQSERKSPCVLHLIEIEFDLKEIHHNENFLFQYHSKNPILKPDMGCNILITTSDFLHQQEALEIDKSIKHHVWIIIGKYNKNHLSWPVLEVQSRISKLHCPGEDKARLLLLPKQVPTCPEYPTWNGKDKKVSLLGLPSDYRQLPNGQYIGNVQL